MAAYSPIKYPVLPRVLSEQESRDTFSASHELEADPIRPRVAYDAPPIFTIPPVDVDASARRSGLPYTYKLYQNSLRQPVTLTLCQSLRESEECASRFLHEPVVGFDMEWKSRYTPGIKSNISLIQVASETEIGLFHIALHHGETPEVLIAPSLRRIIESPHIAKCGVAIDSADGNRMREYLKMKPRGMFELSHLHKLVKYGLLRPDLVNRKLVSMARLNSEHLFYNLHKGKVRTSNWASKLSAEQQEYAATDAYAGIQLFHCLNRKRLEMVPCPPLPVFAELKQSIVLPRDMGLDAIGVRVLDALLAWRSQASRDSGYLDSALVVDDVLYQIALHLPRSIDSLLQINGPHLEDHALGRQWLRIIQNCTSTVPRPSSVLTDSSIYESAGSSDQGYGSDDYDKSGDEELSEDLTDVSIMSAQDDKEDVPFEPSTQPGKTEAPSSDSLLSVESSQSTVKPTQEIPPDRQLLSSLQGLRIKLASKSQVTPIMIASNDVLRTIATIRPRTPSDLNAIDGARALSIAANSHGVSLLDWIRKYRRSSEDTSLDVLCDQLSQATITSAQKRGLN